MGSRVANNPITLPKGVEANINGSIIAIKGAKGQLNHKLHKHVKVMLEDSVITFAMNDEKESNSALAGTSRAIINNMVKGVSEGFETKLVLVGVGYRAQAQGNVLNLTLGFSHPVKFDVPQGINIETPSQTEVLIKGIDKQLVGQVAANIRDIRPPEPYKGKGVRYANEQIILKETKKK